MILQMTRRALAASEMRLLWKFAWNCGWKGIRSVQRFKQRIKRGVYFPPFLNISITSACNLRCTGCWVDVDRPAQHLDFEALNRTIVNAQRYGNSFFGILGGEPFMHPRLLDLFAAHPGCYFQVFTNGQFLTDETAARLRQLGNVTTLISIEGNELVSDQRRGREGVFGRSLRGLEASVRHKLITGVATSVCQNNIGDLLTEAGVLDRVNYGLAVMVAFGYRVNQQPEKTRQATEDVVVWVR